MSDASVIRKRFARRKLCIAIGIGAIIYSILVFRLQQSVPSFRNGEAITGEKQKVTTSQDVPSSVQNSVMNTLSNVKNLDEVVVLGDSDRVGYDVSATVDLGATPELSQGDVGTIKSDVDTFFSSLYGERKDIKHAELFFLQNGQTVAGAGVGTEAYNKLDLKTGMGSNVDFASVLQQSPMTETDDSNESWIETNINGAPSP